MTTEWKDYEQVAAYLLDQNAKEFGLDRVEAKQDLTGQESETMWEIDAKGIRQDNEGFVIVECRRYTKSRLTQEHLGALAYRIMDTGADGGIIVSPLGIQEGAAKVAASSNVLNVQLDANSTRTQFAMRFLKKLMIGIEERFVIGDQISAELIRKCHNCGESFTVFENEKLCPECRVASAK